MVIEAIRELNQAVPFRPYSLRLVSGKVHSVPHPDFIYISPRGTYVMVVDSREHPHWMSSLLIEEVTHARSRTRSRKK
ncbi:MAG: hypothetical protein C5B50_02695 [Verrucomicrobia bacterium]|nr:MAG: hypothetical protein C5B50_02695 [Verrucomicrobiota bacterium]